MCHISNKDLSLWKNIQYLGFSKYMNNISRMTIFSVYNIKLGIIINFSNYNKIIILGNLTTNFLIKKKINEDRFNFDF